MKQTLLVFLILLALSPWVWITARNFNTFNLREDRLIDPSDVIEEVNILQSESRNSNLGPIGKVLVNKPTYLFKNVTERYLESFDPAFLFFKGDLNIRRGTGSEGALLITLLPLAIFEIYKIWKEKKPGGLWLLVLLILSPIPSSFIYVHYDTISKIPLLLVLTFLAAKGLIRLFSIKKTLAMILIVLLFFEVLRLYHNFNNHYPGRLEKTLTLQRQ